MMPYTASDVRPMLRETLCPATAPPLDAARRTHHAPLTDGTACQPCLNSLAGCDGSTRHPCPAVPLVQEWLASDSQHLSVHPEVTWPEVWSTAPSICPICDSRTIADRHLNSSHGPGWRCTLDSSHYWQVRLAPLRRYLAAHPPRPTYPWYDLGVAERRAWLEAHYHPPRLSACPLVLSTPS